MAVFGVGGLGHLAVQYARITGASVIAVDTNADRLVEARALGAEHLVHAGEDDPVAVIQKLGGADVAISTAVQPVAFEQAFGSLARGGALVCVGLPAENHMRVPIFETVLGGLDIRGSIVGTHRDLEEVFELHRRGLTRVMRSERPLDGTILFRADALKPGTYTIYVQALVSWRVVTLPFTFTVVGG